MAAEAEVPHARCPERLDRTMRLGPFASGRQALKVAVWVAAGASIAPFVPVVAWLPTILLGIGSAVYRPGGESLDARLVAAGSWWVRRLLGGATVSRKTRLSGGRGSFVRLGPSRSSAWIRTGGLPLAYLPADEMRQRFDALRELLRTVDAPFLVVSARAPVHPRPFAPDPRPVGESERNPREGYRELVALILRRRAIRRTHVVVTGSTDPGDRPRLERQATLWSERLASLGLRAERLRDRPLAETAAALQLPDPSETP